MANEQLSKEDSEQDYQQEKEQRAAWSSVCSHFAAWGPTGAPLEARVQGDLPARGHFESGRRQFCPLLSSRLRPILQGVGSAEERAHEECDQQHLWRLQRHLRTVQKLAQWHHPGALCGTWESWGAQGLIQIQATSALLAKSGTRSFKERAHTYWAPAKTGQPPAWVRSWSRTRSRPYVTWSIQ